MSSPRTIRRTRAGGSAARAGDPAPAAIGSRNGNRSAARRRTGREWAVMAGMMPQRSRPGERRMAHVQGIERERRARQPFRGPERLSGRRRLCDDTCGPGRTSRPHPPRRASGGGGHDRGRAGRAPDPRPRPDRGTASRRRPPRRRGVEDAASGPLRLGDLQPGVGPEPPADDRGASRLRRRGALLRVPLHRPRARQGARHAQPARPALHGRLGRPQPRRDRQPASRRTTSS